MPPRPPCRLGEAASHVLFSGLVPTFSQMRFHAITKSPGNTHRAHTAHFIQSISIPEEESHMLIDYCFSLLAKLHHGEEGQTAVEYGLVLALIAVVVVVAMKTGLSGVATTVVSKVTTALNAA